MPRGVYLTAAAPRFVQPNGQVRDPRHASDVHATCKWEAIPLNFILLELSEMESYRKSFVPTKRNYLSTNICLIL